MLRIHFTDADLARVRLITRPDPLWDVVLSVHQLQTREAVVFDPWRDEARRAAGSPAVRDAIHILTTINPRCLYFPDFLTPTPREDGIEAGVDAVLSTPKQQMRHELAKLAEHRELPSWVHALADGDRNALRLLEKSLNTYHDAVLAPHLGEIRASFDADRAVRARAVLDGGCDALLDSLRPTLRWKAPVLEADFPREQDLYLDGRGLLLVPSPFCWRAPVTLADPDLPPVVVYPALGRLPGGRFGEPGALAALIGGTRADLLEVLEGGAGSNTGELARAIGVSAATASEQTKVLREAGLVSSLRVGNTVLHAITPLGSALLTGHHARFDRTL